MQCLPMQAVHLLGLHCHHDPLRAQDALGVLEGGAGLARVHVALSALEHMLVHVVFHVAVYTL